MWDILLQNLPIVILVTLAIIICGAELIKSIRVWKEEHDKRINKKVEEKQEKIDMQSEFNSLHTKLDEVIKILDSTVERMASAEQKLKDLTVSDMHDIKAWIVEQYRIYFIEQGWIDAFHAETIDRRYEDYKKEGGNSYIKVLIDRLHSLPMDPPTSAEEKERKKDE